MFCHLALSKFLFAATPRPRMFQHSSPACVPHNAIYIQTPLGSALVQRSHRRGRNAEGRKSWRKKRPLARMCATAMSSSSVVSALLLESLKRVFRHIEQSQD
eukprot:1926867-Pleurochrysis_carterae.AAC.1